MICLMLLMTALTAGVMAQEGNCPGCGSDTSRMYAGGAVDVNASAAGIKVEKTVQAEMIKGETLEVSIKVTNGLAEESTVTLKEVFGGAQPQDMGGFERPVPVMTSAPPYYKMTLELPPRSTKTVTYKIKPLYYGNFRIPGTEVSGPSGKIKSNAVSVNVMCNRNGVCEADRDENALTCLPDCPPKQRDGLCNPLKDALCDPDCREGEDPDCPHAINSTPAGGTTTLFNSCGDGTCAAGEGEDQFTCSLDCPPGGRESTCDATADGVCDADCREAKDPDCGKVGESGLVIILFFTALAIVAIYHGKRWLRKEK